MYACMYACMHACIHTYLHAPVHTYMHNRTCTVHAYIDMHVSRDTGVLSMRKQMQQVTAYVCAQVCMLTEHLHLHTYV